MEIFVILGMGCVFAAFLTSIDNMVGMEMFFLVSSVLAITFFAFAIATITSVTGKVMILCSLPLAMISGSLWLIAKILRKSSNEIVYTTATKAAKSLTAISAVIAAGGVLCSALV